MSADSLNILLQEDLTIRGGAQLWLMNCGSRLQAAGHNVTFLLPTESLIIEDCEKVSPLSHTHLVVEALDLAFPCTAVPTCCVCSRRSSRDATTRSADRRGKGGQV